MADSGRPSIEVLIPHWNRAELLRACLRALQNQSMPVPVCVVDNGSTDRTHTMLREEFPGVRCLALDRNHGFGAALNRGVRSSEADLIVLLNNDAVPDPDFLAAIARAQLASGAEMVAGCLRREDGTIDSLGVEIDRALSVFDVAHADPYGSPAHAAMAPMAPCGGAAAFLRSAFSSVGGFDEGFFAYLEDADLGIRMRMAGMRCAVAYDAFAWHKHAATLGSGTTAKNRMLGRSRGHLMWRYGRSMRARDRMRGLVTDACVYAGQAAIDRNLGSLRGRIDSLIDHRGRARPGADPRFRSVPVLEIGLVEALSRRRDRRRAS